jgi:hypothetical protein
MIGAARRTARAAGRPGGRAGRALRVLVAAVLSAASLMFALPACNTPFIPLPPPGDPTFSPVMVSDGSGGTRTLWETRGAPSPTMGESTVYVFNLDVGAGVIVRAQTDGSYVASPLDGNEGDRVQLSYQTKDGRNSQSICRVLKQGVAQMECPLK